MRHILLVFGILALGALFAIGFVIYGLYIVEIEEQYGDYKDVYYEASPGDVILNTETTKFGFVDKSWKRLYINTVSKDSIDLYTFATKKSYYSKLELYKTNLDTEYVMRLKISELKKLIEDKKLKLRFTHQNN